MSVFLFGTLLLMTGTVDGNWPEAWRAAWENPPAELRPLQIVHGVPEKQATLEGMESYREAGLGGIVCNVNFSEYLRNETHWGTFLKAVEASHAAGLTTWIYDEDGYPSAAAGGLVLEANPDLEALVLAYDASRPDPFVLRRAYEFTHASNNFYAKRRYPNLIEDAATRLFLEKTHDAYAKRLGDNLSQWITAFFTDEPSLMAVDLGPLDKGKTVDAPDPNAKPLPTVPWCSDMAKLYQERYSQDLMAQRLSLFQGDTDPDKQVRRQFWKLVSELVSERFTGRIQEWCHAHKVASSGHLLHEESLVHHVPLYGDSLLCLSRMDIPGMDMLSSKPNHVVLGGGRTHTGWLSVLLPASAAYFNGGRKIMTEVSDFSEGGHAPLPNMLATAAWQAAFGVTEFTSYYANSMVRILDAAGTEWSLDAKEPYRQWCEMIGRMNAILREARPVPRVLLYYPIEDAWSEYRPVAGPVKLDQQSPRLQQIVRAFACLGRQMIMAQTPFVLLDPAWLEDAEVSETKTLRIRGHEFDALAIPAVSELSKTAGGILERFGAAGGRVIRSEETDETPGLRELAPFPLTPACPRIVLGRFQREGREILLLVNIGDEAYSGHIKLPSGAWTQADPATGKVKSATSSPEGVEIALPSLGTVLLIQGTVTKG